MAVVCAGDAGYREIMNIRGVFPFECLGLPVDFCFHELLHLVGGNGVRVGDGGSIREFVVVLGIDTEAAFLESVNEGQHFHVEAESRQVGRHVAYFVQCQRNLVGLPVLHRSRRGKFYGITVPDSDTSLHFRADFH